jgi:ribonuclease P protein subunit RPR2
LKKNQIVKEIAKERIGLLIANALVEVRDNEKIAYDQAILAKKIAMRYRLRLPYPIRQLYCKKCKYFIIPGRNARIRIGRSNTKALRITCLKCNHTYRKILLPRE